MFIHVYMKPVYTANILSTPSSLGYSRSNVSGIYIYNYIYIYIYMYVCMKHVDTPDVLSSTPS